jgi:hypothetical protein
LVVAVLDVVVVAVVPVVVVDVVVPVPVVPVDIVSVVPVVAVAGVAVVAVVDVVVVSSTTLGASVVVVVSFFSSFVQPTAVRSVAETAPSAIIERNFFMSISFFRLDRSSLISASFSRSLGSRVSPWGT